MKKSLVYVSGIALAFGLIGACQSNPTPILRPQAPNTFNGLRLGPPQTYGDIAVKFNNAYHELYTQNEAAGKRDPQNPDKLFVELISQAKTSLDIAIFSIDEPSAVDAVIAAHQRGVKVRVLTDTDNMSSRGVLQPSIEAMIKAGIPVKGDQRTALMHHKFLIMDAEHVLTGSLNLTPYSLYRDNNNSLKISSPQLAQNYQVEFDRMFEQGLLGPNDHKIPYPVVHLDGATISTFFSPKGGTKTAILNALSKANQSIRFMAFSVTDKDIQQLLVRKARSGVKVEGIFDGCMISQYSVYHDLITKNIPVLIDGNQALMHSKVFIIDNQVVITGSYNFSNAAETRNNENTLLINSRKVAGFYEQEYTRLKKASQQNTPPPYDNRACSSSLDDDDINPG